MRNFDGEKKKISSIRGLKIESKNSIFDPRIPEGKKVPLKNYRRYFNLKIEF